MKNTIPETPENEEVMNTDKTERHSWNNLCIF